MEKAGKAPPWEADAMSGDTNGHTGREVFEILVREHADMLTAYLRSLVRPPHVVDELFQDTMVTAWRRLDDYDRERPFGPWLRGIAARLVLQHRRKSARDVLHCDPGVLEALERRYASVSGLPGDTFRDRAGRLLDCLTRLPAKLRNVIELAYARDCTLRHIARALEASEEAIKKRVQRARQLLAECLQSAEVRHEP
jgi:RNA polymerase sigma-70 factor (ECF subfamily)